MFPAGLYGLPIEHKVETTIGKSGINFNLRASSGTVEIRGLTDRATEGRLSAPWYLG